MVAYGVEATGAEIWPHPGVAFEVTFRALGHTLCLSLPRESDRLKVDDFPHAFSDLQIRPREGNFEGFS